MKTVLSSVLAALMLTLFAANLFAEEGDSEGCTDTPQFSRMPGYIIQNCETNEFSFYEFPMADDDNTIQRVEGKYWMVDYYVKEGAKANSYLAIVRNYQNAITKAGGKVLYINDKDWFRLTGKIVKNGIETWVDVHTRDEGAGYWIYIIQKEEMKQDVTSSVMIDSLKATGHVTLAINFETGKSTVKQESQTILEHMIDLMINNPDLKVEIQGHTDNVGKPADNMKLSQDRADALKQVLIDGGVAADRMTAIGYGDTKPVADNKTEEGKALNRRVELVKK
jgi:outer membrane protein OmpA-like peptidoglycan-associated protein